MSALLSKPLHFSVRDTSYSHLILTLGGNHHLHLAGEEPEIQKGPHL